MKHNIMIFWSYFAEIVLASLLFVALFIFWSSSELLAFIKTAASDIAFFSGIMLAGAMAFLWAFYSKSDTEFAKWLYNKGAFQVYLGAYFYAIGVYSLLTILLIYVKYQNGSILSLFTLWLILLSIINVYTFFKNVFDQFRLNMEFNRINSKMP